MEALQEKLIKDVFQENIENVKLYLNAGGVINYVTKQLDTPLIVAVETLNYELVKLLLDGGADPNLEANNTTPLSAAIDVSVEAVAEDPVPPSTAIIKLLVDYGADILRKDSSGESAYDFAKRRHPLAWQLFDEVIKGFKK